MCGIAGCNWSDSQLAQSMAQSVAHRGPDGQGIYTDKGVSLAHRRLSILDLSSAGHQPMSYERKNKRLWITYNGEIYNFREIKRSLEAKGYRFSSGTDTEVILAAYDCWGKEAVTKFNGMFAFAIWDETKQELFLSRDRLGIKPLYYYWDGLHFLFASEIKALLEYKNIQRTVSKKSLEYYLCFGFSPPAETLFQGVKKLLPGHSLLLQRSGPDFSTKKSSSRSSSLQIFKYWTVDLALSKPKLTGSKKDIASQILEHLDRSSKERLLSDVPVGAFLSGGVDSSAIVSSVSRFKEGLKTFSIGFDDDEFNEAPYAQKVSELFGTEHHEKYFSVKTVEKTLPHLAYHYDDLLADYSILPTYLVSSLAKKHVSVCLGGDGGDESFSGYNWYWQHRLLQKQTLAPIALRKIIKPSLAFAGKISKSHFLTKSSRLLETSTLDQYQRYARIRSFLFEDQLHSLGVSSAPFTVYKPYFQGSENITDAFANADFSVYLPNEILHKVDKASMAVGLEARVPFLDHRFVEFALQIPESLRFNTRKISPSQKSKYLLKYSLRSRLPQEILYRKKRGFGIPLKHYFRKDLKGLVSSHIDQLDFQNLGLSKSFVNSLQKDHQQGVRDYSHVLWSLMMLSQWSRKWLE